MTTAVGRTQHRTVHAAQIAEIRRRQGVSAVDNHTLGDVVLTALRASLQEHRRFRLQQLRDLARRSSSGASEASSPAHVEVSHKLAGAARTALEETEAALARVNTGRYGRCGRCGDAISVQLLWSYPQAAYCTRCHRVIKGTQ